MMMMVMMMMMIMMMMLMKNGFPKAFYFLHWILSGMRERRQFVQVNDKTTELVDVQFGVSQGSILGPVLINSYANDLNDIHDCTV